MRRHSRRSLLNDTPRGGPRCRRFFQTRPLSSTVDSTYTPNNPSPIACEGLKVLAGDQRLRSPGVVEDRLPDLLDSLEFTITNALWQRLPPREEGSDLIDELLHGFNTQSMLHAAA